MQNFIENDAQRPDINRIGVVMELGLLGSYVLLGSCDGLHDDLLSTEPEIGQLNEREGFPSDVLRLQKYIFWL